MNAIDIHFTHSSMPIDKLLALESSGNLNLNPHYQRNAIWSAKVQRSLIDTIFDGYPLPNFFFRLLKGGGYEVVDGQQRCRAIFAFWHGELVTTNKITFTPEIKIKPEYRGLITSFKNYPLSICLLEETLSDAAVETFYVLVNRSGLRLNTPEIRKAEYHRTRFLGLASKLAGLPEFETLDIFTDRSSDRMNDVDFVSELLTYLLYGFTDKKETVDIVYKADISQEQTIHLESLFKTIISRINALNAVVPLNKTRFKQKNDFYSVFAFIHTHQDSEVGCLEYQYLTMLRLSHAIKPSQEYCQPLKEYALNCVTQSNSKRARVSRDNLLNGILFNVGQTATDAQQEIAEYFNIDQQSFVRKWGLLLLPLELLKDPKQAPLAF